MPLAILCSGQGQQHAGMFELVGAAPEATELFAVATDLLDGDDPRELVHRATSDQLEANRTAQVLCVLQAVAFEAALGDAIPARRLVAGYSVGEVAAWALAGMISGPDALHLVARRAEAMDRASHGAEGMTFVRGLSRRDIEVLCDGRDIEVAIVNPGNAVIVGGAVAALTTFEDECARRGAERVVRLTVHVASHTTRLSAASADVALLLGRADIRPAPPPGVRLYAGVDGTAVLDASSGAAKLADQISHTVEWARCLDSCVEAGASVFLELGPGHALSALAVDAVPTVPARSADDFRSVAGLRSWIQAANL